MEVEVPDPQFKMVNQETEAVLRNEIATLNQKILKLTNELEEARKSRFTSQEHYVKPLSDFTISNKYELLSDTDPSAHAKVTDSLRADIAADTTNNQSVCRFSDSNTSDDPNLDETTSNFFTDPIHLTMTLRKLNNKKSSSFDKIPNICLKKLPPLYITSLAILFNNCLNLAYFPQKWKTAKVIIIKKKGKESSNPASYRPISLLPNISKIFETVLNSALREHCETNNIIPEHQFGFKHGHSTIHALSKFTADLCWFRNAGDCIGACLVDLEKAFDTVWLDGLFFKLLEKKFPTHLIKILWNSLHNKQFLVADGDLVSTKAFSIENGLQQGTVNSPILFNIFMSDLLHLFDLNSGGNCHALAFADNLLIYINDKYPSIIQKQLQNLFNKIADFFHTWKLKINEDKCETILFRPYISMTSDANKDVRTFSRKFALKTTKD